MLKFTINKKKELKMKEYYIRDFQYEKEIREYIAIYADYRLEKINLLNKKNDIHDYESMLKDMTKQSVKKDYDISVKSKHYLSELKNEYSLLQREFLDIREDYVNKFKTVHDLMKAQGEDFDKERNNFFIN